MNKMNFLFRDRVCAVIRSRLENPPLIPAVLTLLDAGVRVVEITSDTPGAIEALGEIRSRAGDDAFVGMGTVADRATALRAAEAGAEFIVSPNTDDAVMALAREMGIPFFPGALTPTEIHHAWGGGAAMVKIFPADALGPGYIKALKRGPLPQVEMMAVGGITAENCAQYISAGCSAVAVGGSLVDDAILRDADWNTLLARGKRIASAAGSFGGAA